MRTLTPKKEDDRINKNPARHIRRLDKKIKK